MAALPSNVRPGDVISSDLINLLISALGTLDQRVSSLEAGGTTKGGSVIISSLDPPNQQNAGQVLTINGSNFAFPPADNLVTLDNVPVTAFRAGSTGSILKFIVPTSLTVPPDGRNVKITITNSVGTTSTLYRILPFIPAPGNPPVITNVTPTGGGPNILIGQLMTITGQNFAATPTDNIIEFQILTARGTVTYPKTGQSIQITVAQSNTNQIVVTVPDITEIVNPGDSRLVTLQVGVGAQVPAVMNILITRAG